MNTPAPGLQPDIEIQAHTSGGEKRWEISFFAPSTDQFEVQSKQATLRTLQDDSLTLTLVPTAGDVPSFDVRVVAPGREVSIASIKVVSVPTDDLAALTRDLANVLQQNFIKALRTNRTTNAPVDHVVSERRDDVRAADPAVLAPAIQGRPKRGLVGRLVGRVTWKKGVVAAVLLFAVGLVVLGLIPASSVSPLAGGIQPDSYAGIQAQMKKQIAAAANSDQPVIGALQGQTIAIETMKAMGLDPGKANAGCLVGVKK